MIKVSNVSKSNLLATMKHSSIKNKTNKNEGKIKIRDHFWNITKKNGKKIMNKKKIRRNKLLKH